MKPDSNNFQKNYAINKNLGYNISRNKENRFNVDTTIRKNFNKIQKQAIDNDIKRKTAINKAFGTNIPTNENNTSKGNDINEAIRKTYNKPPVFSEGDPNELNRKIQETYNKVQDPATITITNYDDPKNNFVAQIGAQNVLKGEIQVTTKEEPPPGLSAPRDFQGTMIPNGVNLSWNPPEYDGGSSVIGYTLEYSLDQISWTVVNFLNVLNNTVTGLTNSVQYYFRIRARTSLVPAGGPFSPIISPTPLFVPTVPQNFSVNKDDRKLRLTWDLPSSNGGNTIIDYSIEHSLDNINWVSSNTVLFPQTSGFTANSLSNGQIYWSRMRARNQIGSGPVTASISAIPDLRLEIAISSAQGMIENPEYIEIFNPHPYQGNLTGWYLISHDNPPECQIGMPPDSFNFPTNATIEPLGNVRIYSGGLANPLIPFFWNISFNWNNNGDIADLYDYQNRWMSTLVTGECLSAVAGYRISYPLGTGNNITSVPVYPDLGTYTSVGMLPSNWTRNSGLIGTTGTATGWRMKQAVASIRTMSAALNNNETIDFNIQNIGSTAFTFVAFTSLRMARQTNGPTRVALLYNKTNNWSSYDIVFDEALPSTTTNELAPAALLGFNNLELVVDPTETAYFRFVPYAANGNSTTNDFFVVGGTTPQDIILRASYEFTPPA